MITQLPPYLIRAIYKSDTNGALKIYREAVQAVKYDEYSSDIIMEWASRTVEQFEQQSQTRQRYVAEIEGAIVGYSGLDLQKLQLTECYVSPQFSGRGIGQALVNKVVTEAKTAGLAHLDVMAALNAVQFYKFCGFEERDFDFLDMDNNKKLRFLWMRRQL